MRRFVFVTQELAPNLPGGAGTVVAEIAAALGRDHDVKVILAAPSATPAVAIGFDVVPVELADPDGSLGWFIDRSQRVASALAGVVAGSGAPDMVEFTDFEALGFWALSHRGDLHLDAVPVGIRVHGPVGAIAAAVGAIPEPWPALDALEGLSLAMADFVVTPSKAIADWVASRYDLEAERLVVAPPIVPAVQRRRWVPGATPCLAVYGRLTEAKGVHDLALAVTPLLESDPALRVLFIGPDGWSAVENRPMSEVVRRLIPAQLAPRVEIVGPMDRERALDALAAAWMVVAPSRFETFCLTAHEVRRAGTPVVVPDLPAFAGLGRGDGVVRYDGTVGGLTVMLRSLLSDRDRLARLASEPPPVVDDPLPAYLRTMPTPRHPNEQAGLATVALHRLEGLLASPPKRGAAAARFLLTALPRPLASLAVRVLPRRLKDRFREFASWPAEVERRARAERRSSVEDRIGRGRFAALEHPRVSVVVPCFNQGAFLMDALVSVFDQTFDSWEVVVVDDGSNERSTWAVLAAIDWPRVTVVRQDNRGLPGARNAGIAQARGEFILPLDADDELHRDYLGRMVEALDGAPDVGYAHCWAELFGDVSRVWATRPFNEYAIRLSNSVFGGALIRRDALNAVGRYDPTLVSGNEDWDLWLRMLEAGYGNVQVRQPLYRYRKHGVSMSVHTESGFESGWRALVGRHLALFEGEELRRVKLTHYPAVTLGGVLESDRFSAEDDIEVIESTDMCDLAVRGHGKYVAMAPAAGCAPDVLDRLVDRLEDTPSHASAGEGEVVLIRRWALLDPAAPLELLHDIPRCPDESWLVPDRMVVAGRSLAVERQRPEVAARIPEGLLA